MSLESFKTSAKGAKLAPLFSSGETVDRMVRKSEAGRPAVEAIGKEVAARVGSLDDQQKKLVGRWAKEVLEPRGWTPDRKGRVAPGHFFARGTIYRRASPAAAPLDGAARMAKVRQMVKRLPHRVLSSDELIRERRRQFDAEE